MKACHSEEASGLFAVAPEGTLRINGFKLQWDISNDLWTLLSRTFSIAPSAAAH